MSVRPPRVVYVITDAPPRPLHERVRDLCLSVLAWLLMALAVLGQALGLLIGALDALIAARLGTRRIAYLARLLCQAIRDSRSHRFGEDDDL
ncbi:hypothetical protein [Streptosporangium jomthongense]|uniref:Uncharacterized protein n=1 Tax=Streptosporangium jomthongense TaxID=1193683 RepID=A0ABV8F6C6_9ACTN